ncbi:MAG: hypothetical protein H6883_07700 [Rhodobiaceae bacterium]|nr:hypothetical protein [Rhodobiaceae bacterium]MCC0056004.1 hypothetical protein [Rhodobiaceae bacterium]
MVESQDNLRRGQMNEMYGIVDRSRSATHASPVPIIVGFGLIVGLLLIALFLGASA